jgi:hypothetical protein
VWHRDPDGRWTFFQDVAPAQGCSRSFGSAVADVAAAAIDIDWVAPTQFSVTVTDDGHRLDWSVTLTASPITRAISAVGSLVPVAASRHISDPNTGGGARVAQAVRDRLPTTPQ